MSYIHDDWTNFGDISPWHGQLWIKNATVDNDDEFAECVETIHYEGLGENQLMILSGSIYMPKEKNKIESALSVIGVSPSRATWIDKALAFHAYWGIESDYQIVLQLGKNTVENFYGNELEADYILHGNTNLSKYIKANYLN